MMPISDTFTLNKIEIDFVLSDGTVKSIVSKVEARKKAEETYEDKVAQGHTAVLATLPKLTPKLSIKMMKIMLGNMPPNS